MKASQREFDGMPEPTEAKPRKGSRAWKQAEWNRFLELAAEHDGLTLPVMASIALGLSRTRVMQLMDDGKLRSWEIMGKRFLSCRDVEEFSKLERDTRFRYETVAA